MPTMNSESPFSYRNYATVSLVIDVRDPDVIERVTGPDGDDWRSAFYGNLKTADDVIAHFTYNFLANAVGRVNRLDGWADVADDAVIFTLEHIDHEVEAA